MKFLIAMLLAAISSVAITVTFNLEAGPAYFVGVACGCVWAFISLSLFD